MSLAAIRFQKSQAAVPLSEREVFTIVRSWKGVRRQIAEAGADMFIRYVIGPFLRLARFYIAFSS